MKILNIKVQNGERVGNFGLRMWWHGGRGGKVRFRISHFGFGCVCEGDCVNWEGLWWRGGV